MVKKGMLIIVMILIIAISLSSIIAYAGGDKNTLRGSEGEQIGEPTPDPTVDPAKERDGDPNPNIDNVPAK